MEVFAMEQCDGPGDGDDCGRTVHRAGKCRGHYWQLQNERPLTVLEARRQTRWQMLHAAAIALADAAADTADEYERAKKRLGMAALRYGRGAE